MLFIFLSWLYIFYTAFVLGFSLDKLANLKCNNTIVIPFLGLFSTSIIASIWAFFGRINIEYQIFVLFLNITISLKYKTEIIALFKTLIHQINEFSKSSKIFLFLITILILAQSASVSNFIDNETYYIQTIKWLNEYGFVKGLVNLHVFFGQTSGWHITQSSFNYSFLTQNFNDLNGFILLLINLFALTKLNLYEKNKNQLPLIIGVLPIANLLFFQLIGAPSPDLAVYLISFLLFYYFLNYFNAVTVPVYNLIFILAIFLVHIKISALPILMLPLILFILNFKKLIFKIQVSYLLGTTLFILFILKNLTLTGYPLFPCLYFKDLILLDYTLPIELYNFSFEKAKLYEFMMLKSEYINSDVTAIFIKWFLYSGIDSLFNFSIIACVLITPLFLRQYLNKTSYWILYLGMLTQLVFLFLTTPQYRFILHYILFFGFIVGSYCINYKQYIMFLFYLSLIPITYIIIFPVKCNTENTCNFTMENALIPSKNSNLNTKYTKTQIGKFDYFSPDKKTFFWATGDGSLPCVNKKQLLYFKNKLGYIPQKRTANIKDGFYSKKITVK